MAVYEASIGRGPWTKSWTGAAELIETTVGNLDGVSAGDLAPVSYRIASETSSGGAEVDTPIVGDDVLGNSVEVRPS